MRKQTENNFKDGMMLGVHPSVQPKNTTRKMVNFRIMTRDNTSFIVTSVRGNELKGALPSNFVPVASDERNGVAYILSAEVIGGVPTGRGEIGCFPSPDYSTGAITYSYRPFMNYAGDDNSSLGKNAAFRSIHFNLDLVNLVDMELQNDYDGSINVIFTDGKNPIRIINSGFAVLPGSKYQVIDRTGTKDTNRYAPKNFENVINLIAKSTKIMKVVFNGAESGGAIEFGNIQCYFAYGTSDGNETEIVGQSFSIPIFNGEKVASISGGRSTGEKSNKMVRFTLSNLDESYSYIALYVIHADGMTGQVRSGYRVNQRYNINASSMELVFTGFEERISIPIDSLEDMTSSIDTAGTIAQSQGYLMAADIKEKNINVEPLKKFCRMIKIGHKQVTLDLIGPEDNFTRVFDETLNQSSLKAGTAGYNGGYANPRNVHDNTGYWGGEAYPFTARLIFPDGSLSPLFPCVGVDNVVNNNTALVEGASEATINALDATDGFSSASTMLNNRGIYRFPNRTAPGSGPLFYRDPVSSEGRITVNGVTFKIPALDIDLGGGKTIKDYTIGIQFFRGERRPDVLIQGTMIDMQIIPVIRYDDANTDQKLWNYNNGNFTEENSKMIPAFAHLLESNHSWHTYDTPAKRSNSDKASGIFPFKLNFEGKNANSRDPWVVFPTYKSPFALISTDLIVNPGAFSGIAMKDVQARLLYRMTHRARVKTAKEGQSADDADHFSALIPESSSNLTSVYNARCAWMPENMEAKNQLGFSSAAYFQCRRNNGGNYRLFRNKYNAFLGVRLDGSIRGASPSTEDEGGNDEYNLLNKTYNASYLANIYDGPTQRTYTAVRQVYQNIDGIRYFPISGRMYWDSTVEDADPTNTLESKLDGDRKITLFGGDCFINYTLRKLYSNAEFDTVNESDKNGLCRTGYTIGVVNEANYNASIRSLETINLVEGERQHPFAYVTKETGIGDGLGRNNQYRDYYRGESSGYNKGYSMLSGNVFSQTLPLNAPFQRSHWFARVWHSGKHITNSFENGYRRFFPGNYHDYASKNGRIVKLVVNNNRLHCIQERSVGIIPVNERIQTGKDSGGPIYTESAGVLSPHMGMLSEEIGSKHKSSIVSTDNAVYGVSFDQNVIWGTQGDGPLMRISDLSIASYLDDNFPEGSEPVIEMLTSNIVSAWNKKYDEVLFTFYSKESGNYSNNRSFTVQFNETTRKIHSFYSFVPVRYLMVGKDLYSFNVSGPQGIWLHDSPNVPFCSFYGTVHDSIITYVVNEQPKTNKVFTNKLITSNYVKPEKIKYMVEGAFAEHELVNVPNDIALSNTRYKNRNWEVVIPKIKTVHNQDHEQTLPDTKAGATSLLKVRSRVKDRFMITEITYHSDKQIELESVTSFYKEMP